MIAYAHIEQSQSPDASDNGSGYAAVITSLDNSTENEMHFYFDAAAVCFRSTVIYITHDFCFRTLSL